MEKRNKVNQKNVFKRLKVIGVCSLLMVITMPEIVFAGKIANNFNNAADSILGEGANMVKGGLLLVLLVIGAMFFYGGDRMKESIKARVAMTAGGCFFILGAGAIAATMMGWFQ